MRTCRSSLWGIKRSKKTVSSREKDNELSAATAWFIILSKTAPRYISEDAKGSTESCAPACLRRYIFKFILMMTGVSQQSESSSATLDVAGISDRRIYICHRWMQPTHLLFRLRLSIFTMIRLAIQLDLGDRLSPWQLENMTLSLRLSRLASIIECPRAQGTSNSIGTPKERLHNLA